MSRRPVRIAGGGLSGLSAAITLARAGVPAVVHERGRAPGCRHHYDLQGIENWSDDKDVLERLAAFGLELDCPLHPVGELHLIAKNRENVVVSSPEPLAYLVHRGARPGTLDEALRRQAERLGVPIRCGAPLDREAADIWAVGPPAPIGIVSGLTFQTSHPFLSVCLLDEDHAPGGYAYLNIAGGEGTLAVVLLHSFDRARGCLDKAEQLFRRKFAFDLRRARRFGGYGFFRPSPRAGASGPLRVGEAGGFQDLLFGFGIYMALASGHLAARALLEGAPYERLWRAELAPTLRASLSNRLLFELGGSWGHRFMIDRARALGPRAFLARWYRYGVFKAAIYAVARGWFSLRFRGASG